MVFHKAYSLTLAKSCKILESAYMVIRFQQLSVLYHEQLSGCGGRIWDMLLILSLSSIVTPHFLFGINN
jgi:hypothetical protein